MNEQASSDSSQALPGNWWIENLLRPMLIAGMATCLAAPVVHLLAWVIEGWDGGYFLVFVLTASLEGLLSERALRRRRITGWAYVGSRLSELLILLLLLKLVNYVPLGLGQLWADALVWTSDPYQFINSLDMLTGMVFILVWLGSIYVSRMAMELDVDEVKAAAPADRTSIEYYMWLTQPAVGRDRQQKLESLADFFTWGGIVLLVVSAVVHFFLPSPRALAVPLLLYFALGIALLTQARFSVTHAGWQIQGLEIQPGIGRRWLLWAVLFLVSVALIALFLPTGYALGPIQALLGVFGFLLRGITFLVSVLFYLLALLLSYLFPTMEPPESPTFTRELLAPPGVTATDAASSPWLEVLFSALFWLVVLLIVGYAMYRFLRDRFGALPDEEGAPGSWWQRLLAWLRDLWRSWRAWRHGVQARLTERRAGRREGREVRARAFRFFFPGRLPPREQVRYFYLSAERRAAQAGKPRATGQTPYEYQADLDQRFPELEPDLEGLTEAFVGARYSPKAVEREDADAVKPLWQRIKAALRRKRARS